LPWNWGEILTRDRDQEQPDEGALHRQVDAERGTNRHETGTNATPSRG